MSVQLQLSQKDELENGFFFGPHMLEVNQGLFFCMKIFANACI